MPSSPERADAAAPGAVPPARRRFRPRIPRGLGERENMTPASLFPLPYPPI
ncbi:hypothetical protein [Catenuloplanes indicus]|uniref:Uncharacterized protein n=1 Tax=Catenuloplanes indicus TaxID=137267 RepID=A0AAE4B108_9ACTN|nr:hypothetical protein [Catenuloplanes indicus]MDQ0367413.1 hypothetical protein [Catenuloplanes indicus]